MNLLTACLADLGWGLSEGMQKQLIDYTVLLKKWNRVHNLTALRDDPSILTHHLLDSLSILPYMADAARLADIGSGGGLPGIPLAIARPNLQVSLVESNHKKIAFLRQAKIELGLTHLEVQCTRVEAWQATELFDFIVSRAFSDLTDFVRLSGHLLAQGGTIAAMKGIYPYEEIAQLPIEWQIDKVIPLRVPGIEAARHLVCIKRV